MPSPHLFVERNMAAVNHAANVLSQAQGVNLMAAVNHAANFLSQAQGVKKDSNVEYIEPKRSVPWLEASSLGLKGIMQKA